MIMVPSSNQETEILHQKNLTEAFFNNLFDQLKINENHQKEQESFLLEMYLSHINLKLKGKNSDLKFKEFIDIIEEETITRLDTKTQSDKKTHGFSERQAYNQKRSYLRHVSNNMKVLYSILRDSLCLQQENFFMKYKYLSMQGTSLDILKHAAGFFKREDFFWIEFLKLAYLKGIFWNQIHDAVFECARPYSSNTSILQELQHAENHQLLQSIQTNFSFGTITKDIKQNVIVPSLKEFFASDNPFDWKAGAAEGSAIISSTIPFNGKAGAADSDQTISSPIGVFEKARAAEGSPAAVISPTIGLDVKACEKIIREKLLLLKKKETSQPSKSTDGIARKTHRSKNPVSFLTQVLSAAKISAEDAFTFFETKNKDMAMARNKLKFTSFGEDDLISRRGFRSYFANDTSKTMAAGFCTCIVHAIRLLCLCTTAATEPDLQDLLNIMVTDTMKNERLWDVDEVMSRLKIELSTTTFQSLAQSFAVLIRQSTYLGELSWTRISSRTKLIEDVKFLYDSNDANKGENMLFISFSQVPAVEVIDLPYVFHLHEDSDIDTPDASFQTVGMVYSSLEGDKPNSYAFHFITYSRCSKDGQYQVLKLIPDSHNPIHCLHKVSHSLEKAKKGEEPLIPIKLRVLLQESGHSLVGLILIRNIKQCGAKHPFLIPEVIRCILNPTLTSARSDPCELTCAELQKLNSNDIWLDDLLVQAIVHLMFESLLQKKRSSEIDMPISLQSSCAYELHCSPQFITKCKLSLHKLFSSSQHIFYIVNEDNAHWICLCLSMKWRRIFSLDSKNGYSNCQSKASKVIRVLGDHFNIHDIEWVRLKSPHQKDGTSCGIFTALNSAFLLKSILEGSFTTDGPADMKRWENKNFTEQDKFNIRMCAKDVIYGVKDAAFLLKWLD
jgi:hypothetical protein